MVREEHCKKSITDVCGERSQCLSHTGFVPTQGMCDFPVYIAQAPGCSAGELSKAGPGFVHFPGLSHSGSGSQALHKAADSWACIWCLSQVWAAQAARCLVSTLSPGERCVLSPPQSQPLGVLGAQWECCLRCACVSSGRLISDCDPPGGCQWSRIPGRLA